MSPWGRVAAVVAGLAAVAMLTWAVVGDAERATAVGTLLTATVAAASLVVVVQLDRQLVAIERERRAEETRPHVTARFTGHRTPDQEVGGLTFPGTTLSYLLLENTGAGPAYRVDVTIESAEDRRPAEHDLHEIEPDELPLPLLDAGGAYPLPLGQALPGTPRRYRIRLSWAATPDGEPDSRELILRRA